MNDFTEVYESMLGILTPEASLPWVSNAFAEGQPCELAYEEMRTAYERLCQRLGGVEEDPDLDMIVDSMERIQRDLCRRMWALRIQDPGGRSC